MPRKRIINNIATCNRCGKIAVKTVIIENSNGRERMRVCLKCLDIILNMRGVQVIDSNIGKDK